MAWLVPLREERVGRGAEEDEEEDLLLGDCVAQAVETLLNPTPRLHSEGEEEEEEEGGSSEEEEEEEEEEGAQDGDEAQRSAAATREDGPAARRGVAEEEPEDDGIPAARAQGAGRVEESDARQRTQTRRRRARRRDGGDRKKARKRRSARPGQSSAGRGGRHGSSRPREEESQDVGEQMRQHIVRDYLYVRGLHEALRAFDEECGLVTPASEDGSDPDPDAQQMKQVGEENERHGIAWRAALQDSILRGREGVQQAREELERSQLLTVLQEQQRQRQQQQQQERQQQQLPQHGDENDTEAQPVDTMGKLLVQQFVDTLCELGTEAALQFARDEMRPYAQRHPAFLPDVEKAMTLVFFWHPGRMPDRAALAACPGRELLKPERRTQLASEVNAVVLRAQGEREQAYLPHLLQLLEHTQRQVRNKQNLGGQPQDQRQREVQQLEADLLPILTGLDGSTG